MVSEPSDFNLLIQKDFSEQVRMNNEPLQSGSTHDNTFRQIVELFIIFAMSVLKMFFELYSNI